VTLTEARKKASKASLTSDLSSAAEDGCLKKNKTKNNTSLSPPHFVDEGKIQSSIQSIQSNLDLYSCMKFVNNISFLCMYFSFL